MVKWLLNGYLFSVKMVIVIRILIDNLFRISDSLDVSLYCYIEWTHKIDTHCLWHFSDLKVLMKYLLIVGQGDR